MLPKFSGFGKWAKTEHGFAVCVLSSILGIITILSASTIIPIQLSDASVEHYHDVQKWLEEFPALQESVDAQIHSDGTLSEWGYRKIKSEYEDVWLTGCRFDFIHTQLKIKGNQHASKIQ